MGKLLTGVGVAAVAAFAVAMFFTGGDDGSDDGWASLPAETDGVLHLDMRSLTAAPLFLDLMRRDEASGVRSARWIEIEQRTGFDPLSDLHALSIGGVGDADDPQGSVYAVVRGRFDRDRWFDFLAEHGSLERLEFDGREVWSITHRTGTQAWEGRLAWIAEDTAVLAPVERFDTLLASMDGESARVADTMLGDRFSSLDGALRVAVLVPESFRTRMARSAAGSPAAAMTAPLQTVDSVLFDLDVETGVDLELSVTADTPDNGKRLYDVFNGYVALGKMLAVQQPGAAEALDALALHYDGNRVTLSLSLSGEQLRSALDAAQAPPVYGAGG